MSIIKSDKEVDKGICGMGVGLGPRKGSDGGRMRDWTRGSDWRGRMGGSDGGLDWRGWIGRVGLGGLDWGDWTGGAGRRVGWGRTGAFHVQKKIKHFSSEIHQKFTKFSKFFFVPSIPLGRC